MVVRADGGRGMAKKATGPVKATSTPTGNQQFINNAVQKKPASVVQQPGVFAQQNAPYALPTPVRASSASTGTKAPAAPMPNRVGGSGGAGGSGGVGYAALAGSEAIIPQADAPKVQDFESWKAGGGNIGDSTWMAENASAQSEYEQLLASLAQQNTSYLNDWNSGMKSMGWKPQGDDYTQGQWDPTDLLGAYGQANNNQLNDFAGRGMLDSMFYGNAQQDLNDRFNRQRSEALNQRNTANQEYSTNKANADSTRAAAQNRALAEAYARYAANYSG